MPSMLMHCLYEHQHSQLYKIGAGEHKNASVTYSKMACMRTWHAQKCKSIEPGLVKHGAMWV